MDTDLEMAGLGIQQSLQQLQPDPINWMALGIGAYGAGLQAKMLNEPPGWFNASKWGSPVTPTSTFGYGPNFMGPPSAPPSPF